MKTALVKTKKIFELHFLNQNKDKRKNKKFNMRTASVKPNKIYELHYHRNNDNRKKLFTKKN